MTQPGRRLARRQAHRIRPVLVQLIPGGRSGHPGQQNRGASLLTPRSRPVSSSQECRMACVIIQSFVTAVAAYSLIAATNATDGQGASPEADQLEPAIDRVRIGFDWPR